MKPVKIATLAFSLFFTASAFAQPPEGGGRPGGGRPGGGRPGEGRPGAEGRPGGPGGAEGRFRMPNPLAEAIDKDKDGELSADEIAGAVEALQSLDKNNDGKIDMAEMRPNMAGMGGRGQGGPEGRGGEGRGGEAGNDATQMIERLLAMDANSDGKLAKDEMPERLQSMFARGDKNSDGFLDKEEIMATVRDRAGQAGGAGPGFGQRGPGGGDFMAQMMERSDANKDGKLSGDEIPPFLRERLEQIDTNKDGELDKAELEAGAARMRGGRGGRGGAEGRGEGGEGRRGQRPPVESDDI